MLQAREALLRQLDTLRRPSYFRDYNAGLVAKLEGMVRDLDECLGETGKPES